MPVLFPTYPKKCGCPSYEWFSRWHAVIIFKRGPWTTFFFRGGPSKKNKKNTCRQGYRVFSNPFIMENDGWVTLQPNPVDLCRWRKKPTGWILALQNTIKVQLEVHWGPLPRCHLKLLRDGMEELWVGFFFSFWFGLFGRKTKVWKKKVEKLYLRF